MNGVYCFEDIRVGDTIPSLVKKPTTTSIFMYAAASWITHRIHYDYPYAMKQEDLPDILVPGTIVGDWYAQLLMDWIGEAGELRGLSYQNRRFMLPGDTITCGGQVRLLEETGTKGFVYCELWMRNQNGIDCAPGKGTVCLPMGKGG